MIDAVAAAQGSVRSASEEFADKTRRLIWSPRKPKPGLDVVLVCLVPVVDSVLRLGGSARDLISETEVESEVGSDLEVILDVEGNSNGLFAEKAHHFPMPDAALLPPPSGVFRRWLGMPQ